MAMDKPMMQTRFTILTTIVLLLIRPSTSQSSNTIALDQFYPVCINLTSSCQSIYMTSITGCTITDFARLADHISPPCSTTCVNALAAWETQVLSACQSDPQNNQNIIGQFLIGKEIPIICPGAVALATSSSTLLSTQSLAPVSSSTGLIVDTSTFTKPSSTTSLVSSSKSKTSTHMKSGSGSLSISAASSTATVTFVTSGTSLLMATTTTTDTSLLSSGVAVSSTSTAQNSAKTSSCMEYQANPFNSCNAQSSGSRRLDTDVFPGLVVGIVFSLLGVAFG